MPIPNINKADLRVVKVGLTVYGWEAVLRALELALPDPKNPTLQVSVYDQIKAIVRMNELRRKRTRKVKNPPDDYDGPDEDQEWHDFDPDA